MTHALTAHLGLGNLDTAFFADYTTMFETFVFTAKAFEIFNRTKYLGTK
ncbi:hypothetical protein MnTg03_01034 [bacterium MnTg03]|nr:hypothetical protein MnTg03_01034 [bacterium MnTg03]